MIEPAPGNGTVTHRRDSDGRWRVVIRAENGPEISVSVSDARHLARRLLEEADSVAGEYRRERQQHGIDGLGMDKQAIDWALSKRLQRSNVWQEGLRRGFRDVALLRAKLDEILPEANAEDRAYAVAQLRGRIGKEILHYTRSIAWYRRELKLDEHFDHPNVVAVDFASDGEWEMQFDSLTSAEQRLEVLRKIDAQLAEA